MKGLGGSITFQSLSRLFPGFSKPPSGPVCLHFVARPCARVYRSLKRQRGDTPARLAGVQRLGPVNRMLPSRVGSAPSGNGSASGRGTAGHGSGVLGGGIRPVLIRAGQALPGVSDSAGAAGRQGERDAVGMLGANGPGGPRGARPGNGAGVTLQTAVQGNMVGLNTQVVLAHGTRFDPDREPAPMCSGSDNDSDSGDDDDPVGSLGDSRRGVKREREMEAAVTGQEVGVAPGGYGMVPGGVAGAKPGKKTRGRVKIKMEFIDNKLRRYTTFSKRKTGIMKKVSQVTVCWMSSNSSCV